jgi:L-ornithine N5-oxygenase
VLIHISFVKNMSASEVPLYDLLGVGFGPANVALAGALIEQWQNPAVAQVRLLLSSIPSWTKLTPQNAIPRKVLFLEKQGVFRWHPGMLLPNTRMQISYLKDLATLRNPRSPITFLSYLHANDRLIQFINRGSNAPSRREYADYLCWAARYVQEHGAEVRFSQEVISLSSDDVGIAHIHFRNTVTGEVSAVRASAFI